MKLLLIVVLLLSGTMSGAQNLRYKIGQMIVAGFKGTELDAYSMQMLSRHFVGGVILFDKDLSNNQGERNIVNPTQLKAFVNNIQQISPGLIFVAVDQEGGNVARLKPERGFAASVSEHYLGRLDCADTTRYWAGLTARQLHSLGINLNLMPCVDLNVNPDNPIIGKRGRSFGEDPSLVVRQAEIVVDEHHKNGVVTALKHFPGHGSSMADSHHSLPDITKTFSEAELQPYRQMIADGYDDIIIVGHLYNANYDATHPASLSKPMIDSLLRKELKFKGVVATDDLNMQAITNHYTYAQAVEMAINAGVDLIIIGNNSTEYDGNLIPRTINTIYKLVQDGVITQARIDEAYARIQKLKTKITQ